MQRHRDLTIRFLSGSSTVLPLDAHGVFSLFGKTGVINDENPVRAADGLDHQLPVLLQQAIGIPVTVANKVAHSLNWVTDLARLR
jgi:hypothetical protein